MNQDVEEFTTGNENVDIKQIGKQSDYHREYSHSELNAMRDGGQLNKQHYFNDTIGAPLDNSNRTMPIMPSATNNLNSYKINYDPEPQIVRKQVSNPVLYKQEVAVRYLKPPTPPPPGPLIIKEVRANQPPPAPPVIIRQRPPRPSTPPPLVIRERPPQAPQTLGPKVITRNLPPPPPPPRRVIIERLPPLPPKPRSIIVERWLPYKQVKRRVVYQKAPQIEAPQSQKNLIIQWEGAQVKVQKEFRNLGISRADPNMYIQQYGSQLKPSYALPDFARSMGLPPNVANNDLPYEQNLNGIMESGDMMPNFIDNNQFMSDLPQEFIGQAMEPDAFNNQMNLISSGEIDGTSGFNSDLQQPFHDMQYDDAHNSFQMGDAYSMMNADPSIKSFNQGIYNDRYNDEMYRDVNLGSIGGSAHHNFNNQQLEDMNDRMMNDTNTNANIMGSQSVAPLMASSD